MKTYLGQYGVADNGLQFFAFKNYFNRMRIRHYYILVREAVDAGSISITFTRVEPDKTTIHTLRTVTIDTTPSIGEDIIDAVSGYLYLEEWLRIDISVSGATTGKFDIWLNWAVY